MATIKNKYTDIEIFFNWMTEKNQNYIVEFISAMTENGIKSNIFYTINEYVEKHGIRNIFDIVGNCLSKIHSEWIEYYDNFIDLSKIKDGDYLFLTSIENGKPFSYVSIYNDVEAEGNTIYEYISAVIDCSKEDDMKNFIFTDGENSIYAFARRATEKEKKWLDDLLLSNGLEWDAERKSFKVLK